MLIAIENVRASFFGAGLLSCFLFVGMGPAIQAQEARPATDAAEPAQAGRWSDPAYVRWLEERSMLRQAAEASRQVSGQGVQWRRPYADPQPREAVGAASVWVLGYPGSVITREGESVIATWADPELWAMFSKIGIDLLHTGPVKRSGGIAGRTYTPTVDGWFDRISLEIDPELGTEAEYRRMVEEAAKQKALIAGDLVPLHTGLGADFLLAVRNHGEYPGMYTMVEIARDDWGHLPEVADLWATAPVSREAANKLAEAGYIPGLINSADAVPNARELSGWDATAEVTGVDGETRRWIYLHYFKPGQPTLNWLDPTMAGPRAVMGDVTKTLHTLGTRVIRLDAVPFLGIEPQPGFDLTLHYQHPLSILGTRALAMYTRKLGGWSFQELNVPLVQLDKYLEHGPDLAYDFFTRTQVVHSLLIGDATLLRQAYRFLLESEIDMVRLVHDLQNHDEITYQLVELDYRGDETFEIDGEKRFGRQIRERVLNEMRNQAAGEAAPYNRLYRAEKDGVATTFAGFIAASLDIEDPYHATPEQVAEIRKAHLLLTMANAMQPGVFSLSGWDLVGALPLPAESVADRMGDADYRWINRGGVDLMNVAPEAEVSAFGLPRAKALYGTLPEQWDDPESYVSQLREMLAAREESGVALGKLIAVPEPAHPAVCVIVVELEGAPRRAVTMLNFGREAVEERIDLGRLGLPTEGAAGRPVVDSVSGESLGMLKGEEGLVVGLDALSGRMLIVGP